MKAEDLIAEVAKRRGVMLTVTDPALLLATILEIQLEAVTKEVGAMLTSSADQNAAASVTQLEAAKGVAQAIITQSGDWMSKQVEVAMDKATGELLDLLAEHEAKMRDNSHRGIQAAVVACSAAVVSLCVLFWILLA